MEAPSDTLFLGGLPPDVVSEELEKIFNNCVGFVSCRLRKDRNNSQVGFAEFTDDHAAGRAKIQYNHYDCRGYPLGIKHTASNRTRVSPDTP
eukprot:16507-Heterococcus_DN1.PRE.1